MKLSLLVTDNFFIYPHAAREEVLALPFADYRSPYDGVTYPLIAANIPAWMHNTFVTGVQALVGFPITPVVVFARATVKTDKSAPNKIHSDRGMGHYAAHIYLSPEWPANAGTSFFTHRTSTDVERLVADGNDRSAWNFTHLIPGRFNRCVIHDADLWHCAEPVGGWGTSPKNGRVVLTGFFKKV